jgi:hypothetical protein
MYSLAERLMSKAWAELAEPDVECESAAVDRPSVSSGSHWLAPSSDFFLSRHPVGAKEACGGLGTSGQRQSQKELPNRYPTTQDESRDSVAAGSVSGGYGAMLGAVGNEVGSNSEISRKSFDCSRYLEKATTIGKFGRCS